MTSLAYSRLPDWIDVASLYGRLYDSLYSPTALTQPGSVRASRTSALASELERIIAARTGYYVSIQTAFLRSQQVSVRGQSD
jgi:hypothetical protein